MHMQALKQYRATPIHRRSFKPVKDLMPTFKWLVSHDRIKWLGKKLAALFIRNSGMRVVNLGWGDPSKYCIDIIAADNDRLIFIAVDTFYKNEHEMKNDNGLNSINKKMLSTIDIYCNENSVGSNFRIDTISVILRSNRPEILHNKGLRIN